MQIMKTEKTSLTGDEILEYIANYETEQVPEFDKLWAYYEGNNKKILDRKTPDPNNPDNKVPVPYGRKIVTTFTGYAYRPKYITYKANEEGNDAFVEELKTTFALNNEHIKTSRGGRNTAIFGVSYELLYIDGVKTENPALPTKAEVRFFTVDPREMILLYDYSSEPKRVLAIRFYKITPDRYKVEVYYSDRIELYERVREKENPGKWRLNSTGKAQNFFGEIPVVAYYFGDEMTGIIKPVLPLIDSYDVLMSDTLNEFDRFAHAYLLMKRFGLTDPAKKEPGVVSQILRNLKRYRVFEWLPADSEIKFLTKDMPSEFIKFMSEFIKDQIHIQSHVPDFTSERLTVNSLSGVAVQRLLFDFENVVSSAEADYDTGLQERIRLIALIYAAAGRADGDPGDVVISHKRNVPLNLKEFADTANTMKQAGFSAYLCADIMPDDIVPDVDEELARQKDERDELMPDIEAGENNQNEEEEEDNER